MMWELLTRKHPFEEYTWMADVIEFFQNDHTFLFNHIFFSILDGRCYPRRTKT